MPDINYQKSEYSADNVLPKFTQDQLEQARVNAELHGYDRNLITDEMATDYLNWCLGAEIKYPTEEQTIAEALAGATPNGVRQQLVFWQSRLQSMDSIRQIVASRLRDARVAIGLSQDQVAQILGWHRPTVSEIELGNRKVSAEELIWFCRVYRVSARWVLYGDKYI